MRSAAFVLAMLLASVPAAPAAGLTEREIADWAIRMGGRVAIEGHSAELSDPTDLRKIVGLTSLHELYLPGPSWNPASGSRLDANEELKNLAGLVNLERIYFSLHFLPNINVNDKGVAYWSKLTKLRDIRLSQCNVEKPDLAPFTDLRSLDVSYTSFNDAGLKTLQGHNQIR